MNINQFNKKTMNELIKTVAVLYGITVEQMFSKCQKKGVFGCKGDARICVMDLQM